MGLAPENVRFWKTMLVWLAVGFVLDWALTSLAFSFLPGWFREWNALFAGHFEEGRYLVPLLAKGGTFVVVAAFSYLYLICAERGEFHPLSRWVVWGGVLLTWFAVISNALQLVSTLAVLSVMG